MATPDTTDQALQNSTGEHMETEELLLAQDKPLPRVSLQIATTMASTAALRLMSDLRFFRRYLNVDAVR
jgi:hypothetical protein